MKLVVLILALCLLSDAAATSADCKQARADQAVYRVHANSTNMTSVTVFVDRAEITRTLHQQVAVVGRFSVVLHGLPKSVELGSVRVEAEGTNVRILDVSDGANTADDPSIQALKAQNEADLDMLRSEQMLLEANATRVTFLMSLLENYTRLRIADPHTIHALDIAADTFDFYSTRAQQLHQQLSEVADAKAQFIKKQSQAQHALRALQDQRQLRAALVDIQLGAESCQSVPGAVQTVALKFRYIVRDASWSPSYDFRARSGDPAIELLYYGNVQQATGENWDKVHLSLSTSDPSKPVSPPLARQRSIHFSEHVEGGGEEAGLRYMQRKRDIKQSAKNAAAGSVLSIPHLVTVPADMDAGSSRRLTIGAYMTNARFTHYATPAVSPHAYLRATMNNTSPYPLLPSKGGTVRVFYDETFVATSELSGIVGVNASFTSFLGVDHAVKIHIDTEVRQHQSSLLGGDVTTFTGGTRIMNRKAAPLYILVQDRVVQSMTDKIQVHIISPSNLVISQAPVDPFSLSPGSSTAHLDNTTGSIQWAVCIAPHSDTTLPLRFTATTTRGRYVTVIDGDRMQFDRSSDAHMEW